MTPCPKFKSVCTSPYYARMVKCNPYIIMIRESFFPWEKHYSGYLDDQNIFDGYDYSHNSKHLSQTHQWWENMLIIVGNDQSCVSSNLTPCFISHNALCKETFWTFSRNNHIKRAVYVL